MAYGKNVQEYLGVDYVNWQVFWSILDRLPETMRNISSRRQPKLNYSKIIRARFDDNGMPQLTIREVAEEFSTSQKMVTMAIDRYLRIMRHLTWKQYWTARAKTD